MSKPNRNGKRVLSVGQCFADHSSITHVLRTSFGAEVVSADTRDEALDLLRQGHSLWFWSIAFSMPMVPRARS